jgi:GNAT superfamily N-acetyltransferase
MYFETASFKDNYLSCSHLHKLHWEETLAHIFPAGLDLKPNQYIALEQEGKLISFAARVNEQIVGYALLDLYQHPFIGGRTCAAVNAFFIEKPHRSKGSAQKFMNYIENTLKNRGILYLSFNVGTGKALGRFLNMQGYSATNIFYTKHLEI